MPNTILWIDRENAKLYSLDAKGVTTKHLHPHDPNHHTHDKRDQCEKDSHRFFRTVYEAVKNENEILVLGPGLTKKHFQNYVETHHSAFKDNILAYITVDHPTDAQIMEYFKISS